ncbi:MAG: UbiA family prenyltransferase, partial [Rhodothermaceae bacterium]|nr:UbiA family prenyltransferase [Rhodothermaceae bacterium]
MALRSLALGLVRLLRPLNMLLFFAGVALGAVLAAGEAAFAAPNGTRVAGAMLSAALIGGAANAINDVYDLAIDRINRPTRPLPAELITPQAARRLWAVLTSMGMVLGFVVSPLHGGIALGAAGLLWLYSARLKRTPGWGNVVVAAILFLAIGYGGLATQPAALGIVLIGATFAFLTTLAREGAKDIEDAAGDAAGGARTLPLVWG